MKLNSRVDDLILLDEDSEDETLYTNRLRELEFTSDYEFYKQLNALNVKNNERFKLTWQDILNRYSKIDDEKESDEIDLATGKIVKDNGHLKSLMEKETKTLKPNIWAVEKELNSKRLEHGEESGIPVQKRPGLLEDYLLLNPSPPKKTRVLHDDDIDEISPTRAKVPLNYSYSSPPKLSFDNLAIHNKQQDALSNLSSSSLESLQYKQDEHPFTESPIRAKFTTSRYQTSSSENSFSQNNHGTSELEFADEYLIVSEIQSYSGENEVLYDCYFNKCDYCTGNKILFKSHLLEKHKPQLQFLGYPIESVKHSILELPNDSEIQRQISIHFPLKFEIPPLPSTHSKHPLLCNHRMTENATCKRWFLSFDELKRHLSSGRHHSHRQQVIICPVLGCGFMTENGYMEWRSHYIEAKHHINPRNAPEVPVLETKSFELCTLSTDGYSNPDKRLSIISGHEQSIIDDDLDELFSNESGLESDLDSDVESVHEDESSQ
jgi:hypothetical protein